MGQEFLQHVTNITQCQWLYCNEQSHIYLTERKAEDEHHSIMSKLKDMMLTDPYELLPSHYHLLEQYFVLLGEGSLVDRQY